MSSFTNTNNFIPQSVAAWPNDLAEVFDIPTQHLMELKSIVKNNYLDIHRQYCEEVPVKWERSAGTTSQFCHFYFPQEQNSFPTTAASNDNMFMQQQPAMVPNNSLDSRALHETVPGQPAPPLMYMGGGDMMSEVEMINGMDQELSPAGSNVSSEDSGYTTDPVEPEDVNLDSQKGQQSGNIASQRGLRERDLNSAKLWEWVLHLLMNPGKYAHAISWEDKSKGLFKILDEKELTKYYNHYKSTLAVKPRARETTGIKYESILRALRHCYKTDVMVRVNKKHKYEFGAKALNWRQGVTRARAIKSIENWEAICDSLLFM